MEEVDNSVTEEEIKSEVQDIIRNMKKCKAPGEDGITNEGRIYGGEEVWDGNGIQEEWKGGNGGIIKPIYKKGCKEDEGNYRGITLMDSGYKIYAEWLRRRLNREMGEKIKDKIQYGFRKGRCTMEAIYVVSEIIEKHISKEKGIRSYVLWI